MSDSNEDTFTITDAQINWVGVLAFACTIPGTCICFLVLLAYAIAAYAPKARRQLDRVSFRLLISALLFNVIFGIAYAATPTSPGPGCNFGAFAINFTLSFSTFFTACIAINLQLVLVHGVNGNRMEKYYFIGTTILSVVLNVPTYALHQFGWDEESATCWYKNHDDKLRLRWIIGTQSFWMAFAATIETICSGVVLYRFHIHGPTSRRNTTKQASALGLISYRRSTYVSQDPRYRTIILRIALYPIVSLMLNYSTVALDLYTTIRGLNTQLDFRLLVLDLILYGSRTLAYGVLAAMDPSFVNALREIRGSKKRSPDAALRTLTSVYSAHGGAGVLSEGEDSKLGDNFQLQQITHSEHMMYNAGVSMGPEASQGSPVNVKKPVVEVNFEEIRDFERQL